MTFNCGPAIKGLAIAWFVLPLAATIVLGRLIPAGAPYVQESSISYRFIAAIGGSWMLLGLALLPFLGAHGRSIASALGLVIVWSGCAGAWMGPEVVEVIYRPPPSAVGVPVEFAANGVNRGVLTLRPTSGEAASARFRLPPMDSLDAYTRAGNRPVKGKVYRGGGDLWFARLD